MTRFRCFIGITHVLPWLLCLLCTLPMQANAALEEQLQSEHYQLIKLANADHPPGRWDKQHNATVIDLLKFKAMVEANPDIPDNARRLFSDLTQNYTRSYELRGTLKRDDTVYFSDYWTRRDSVLRIVEYKKAGSSKDLTVYLGPLANIPTGSYGVARFELQHKGETVSFWGAVQKKAWSLRTMYWSSADIFFPVEDAAPADILIVQQRIPTNYLDSKSLYLLMPR